MAKRKKPTAKHLKPKNHALITVVSLVVLAVTTAIASTQNFVGIEYQVFKLIYSLPAALTPLFWTITQLGSAWMVIILSLLAYLKHVRGLAHKILINGIVTYVAVEYLKIIVDRPRPAVFYSSIKPREMFAIGNGFPSGHTAMATVLALTAMPYLPKKYYWLVPTWIIGVALSRVYLGVHAPLDVIGGVALGICIASFQHTWTAKRRSKKLEKANQSA